MQSQENAHDDFSSREAITDRLDSLQLEIADANLPVQISEDHLLQQLEIATYQHLEAVETLDDMVGKANKAQEDLNSWSGYKGQPFFSVRFVLNLRAQQQLLELETRSTEALYDIIQRNIENTNSHN